jgi:hypothetical protein
MFEKLERVPQLATQDCHWYVVVIEAPPPVFHVPSSTVSVDPTVTLPERNGAEVFDGATTPASTWNVLETSVAAA